MTIQSQKVELMFGPLALALAAPAVLQQSFSSWPSSGENVHCTYFVLFINGLTKREETAVYYQLFAI